MRGAREGRGQADRRSAWRPARAAIPAGRFGNADEFGAVVRVPVQRARGLHRRPEHPARRRRLPRHVLTTVIDSSMIDLYYWTTPNGHKITIFLEETGLAYTIKPINIGKGEQFEPAFLAISPNNRIPAIVDHAPRRRRRAASAVRVGRDPALPRGQDRPVLSEGPARPLRVRCSGCSGRWAGLGPMAGQNHHFAHYAPEKIPYAIDRYVQETGRLYARAQQAARRPRVHRRRATRSPTWRAIRGCRPSGRGRTSTTSRTSSAGTRRSRAPGGRARLRDRERDQPRRPRSPTSSRARSCSAGQEDGPLTRVSCAGMQRPSRSSGSARRPERRRRAARSPRPRPRRDTACPRPRGTGCRGSTIARLLPRATRRRQQLAQAA